MGVLQFLQECCVETNHFVMMATDPAAGKPRASRSGDRKATKHIQPRFLYIHDLMAAGAVRPCKVDTKDNLADLHTKFLPVYRRRNLFELTNCDAVMIHANYMQLAKQQVTHTTTPTTTTPSDRCIVFAFASLGC